MITTIRCKLKQWRSGYHSGVGAWLAIGLLFGAVAVYSTAGVAASLAPLDEPDAYVIKLAKDARGGRTAFLSGLATPAGDYLKLTGLWGGEPVKLLVAAQEKSRVVRVELRTYHWTPPLRSCSTLDSGECGFVFTNQGDVLIKIISTDGSARVTVAVRVDEAPAPQMKPILVPRELAE